VALALDEMLMQSREGCRGLVRAPDALNPWLRPMTACVHTFFASQAHRHACSFPYMYSLHCRLRIQAQYDEYVR